MKYVVRTSVLGKKIPFEEVEDKKQALREKIIASGFHYLEYQADLGTKDVFGEGIAEVVTVLEVITGEVYV